MAETDWGEAGGTTATDREQGGETAGELTFEAAFRRLEELVRTLEGGQATLEESLALFEEGVKLANFCLRTLQRAEGKVEKLLEGPAGELFTEPLVLD